jgi:hypothetical protein
LGLELRTACFQLCGSEPQFNVASLPNPFATLLAITLLHFGPSIVTKKTLYLRRIYLSTVLVPVFSSDRHISIFISRTSETGARRASAVRIAYLPSTNLHPRSLDDSFLYCFDTSASIPLTLLVHLYASCPSVCAISTGITCRRRHCSSCLGTISYHRTIFKQTPNNISQYVEDYSFRKGVRRKWREGKEGTCYSQTEFEVRDMIVATSSRVMLFDIGSCDVHPRNRLFHTPSLLKPMVLPIQFSLRNLSNPSWMLSLPNCSRDGN